MSDLASAIEPACARMLWSLDEGRDDAVRGHAYLVPDAGDRAELLWLVHGEERTPRMVAMLNAWEAARDFDEESVSRRNIWWKPAREDRWSFTFDAGRFEATLRGRELRHRMLLGSEVAPTAEELFALFPSAFVRRPVHAFVASMLGEVSWPEDADAMQLCPRFRCARAGDTLIVVACRYGSVYSLHGQDRTASVWRSSDGGATWSELPWGSAVGLGSGCWPPEQIDRVTLRTVDAQRYPVIEWEDPWVPFEPGYAWSASWEPGDGWLVSNEGPA